MQLLENKTTNSTWKLNMQRWHKSFVTKVRIFATFVYKSIIRFVRILTHQRISSWKSNVIVKTPRTSSYQNSNMLIKISELKYISLLLLVFNFQKYFKIITNYLLVTINNKTKQTYKY